MTGRRCPRCGGYMRREQVQHHHYYCIICGYTECDLEERAVVLRTLARLEQMDVE